MQYKQLGNTDIQVSKICLWTMTWGSQNTEIEAHEQLDYTFNETDINFMDTAEVYAIPPNPDTQWLTEAYIWNWFIKNPRKRKNIILATKMVWRWMDWIRNGKWLIPDDMSVAIDGSLQRLQTDYIDLYQLHWPQRQTNFFGKMNWDEAMKWDKQQIEKEIYDTLKAFETLRKQGKVKYLWLSNETPWGIMKFLEVARKHGLPEIQTVQNPYSLMQRQYDSGMSEISTYEWVGLLGYSPLAGWVLTGKYQWWAMPEWSRYALWWAARMPQNLNERSLKFVDDMQTIADKAGISLAELSVSWVNDRDFVHSNIIGATNMKQLKENIWAADIILSPEIRQEIDDVFSKSPNPATF